MKTLKQLREEYDSRTLPQVAPEELVLEDLTGSKRKELGDYSKKRKTLSDVPSPITMPNLLMFRRITYRRYPDNQTVALYYSKTVDKYLSIPFGPTGNLNLSEATVYDTMEELNLGEGAKWEAVKGGVKGALHGAARGMAKGSAIAAEPGMAIGGVVGAAHGAYKGAKNAYNKAKENMEEDWQDVNRKDKTDGLSQKAVNAYRREHPGSKLKTAVTEKNPTGKRASRRKSFCSRMGGMKKRLTSAKNARDPDSPINKALRRWNCEESFKARLEEKRQERLDENPLLAIGGALARSAVAGAVGDAVISAGKKAVGYIGSKLSRSAPKLPKPKKAPPTKTPKAPGRTPNMPDLNINTDQKDQTQSQSPDVSKRISNTDLRKGETKTKSYTPTSGSESSIDTSRRKTLLRKDFEASSKSAQKAVSENKIDDLRHMVNEGITSIDLPINGRSITLNTSMAKRILEVYDSVNTKNKKIVEGMLNEDLESFKKLLNFSIRK